MFIIIYNKMGYNEPNDVWFSEDDGDDDNAPPIADFWESNIKRYENERKEKAQRSVVAPQTQSPGQTRAQPHGTLPAP